MKFYTATHESINNVSNSNYQDHLMTSYNE